MMNPGRDWKETVGADEAQRHAEAARHFAELQLRQSARHGQGRALHRKQLLGARGTLTVHQDLPEFARQGLFAEPASLPVTVRLSNGGMGREPDRKPDIRGFSLAVRGVRGDSALGTGTTDVQCFALINRSNFGFANSADFIGVVMASTRGPLAVLKQMAKRHGWVGGLVRLVKLLKSLSQPFAGFAHQNFYSAAPIACGPYAVKVRLRPTGDHGAPDPQAQQDWGADMARRLARGPLEYALELQPFVNETETPIEDASVDWTTPFVQVATLTLPQQVLNADDGLAQEIEAGIFDPWAALAAHRPLGEVMRARKVVYYESQKGRQAAA
jgi:hypothetical protein